MNSQTLEELKNLKERVEGFLTKYPEFSTDILSSVSKGLEKFRETMEKQKSNEADKAVMFMIDLITSKRLKSREKAIRLCHVIPFHFPNGFIGGYSTMEIEFLNSFCILYFNEPNLFGSDWEATVIHKKEYFIMLKKQWDERQK